MHCYHVCGLTIRSELEFPGAVESRFIAEDAVTIRFGEVAERLPNATTRGAAFQAAPGLLLLVVPNVGRYLVREGREIIIQPVPSATESEIRLFLMGSAFGALLHQRGLLPLHASSIHVGDGCVAFAGISGAGKSTLAALLKQRGYEVVGDDICPIRGVPGIGPVAYPSFARLKLWADSLNALGENPDDHVQLRSAMRKFEVRLPHPTTDSFVPLRCVYLLCEARDRDPEGIEPVGLPAGLRAMTAHTYRFRYLKGFGRKQEHFRLCAGVLSTVPVFRLRRPLDFGRAAEPIDWLEEHWRELAAESNTPRQLPAAA